MPYGIENLVFAISLAVEQESHLLSELFRLGGDRTAVGHLAQSCNGGENTIEPFLSLLEAGISTDVVSDFADVLEGSWCDLNVKSHVSCGVFAQLA